MKVKSLIILFIGILLISCSGNEREMTEIEQYMARKYKAEYLIIDLKYENTTTNGKVTKDRKFLSMRVKNTSDIQKIIDDNNYSNELGTSIKKFVIDSLNFDGAYFQPEEIQIEFIKENSYFLFNSKNRKTVNFKLSNKN